VARGLPAAMAAVCHAAVEGDADEARSLNEKLMPLHTGLFVEANPIPVKWALAEMGRIGHGIRLPLTELSDRYHDAIRRALEQAEVKVAA